MRRPITARLVLQSLIIGFVLVVVSVPVLAIVAEHVPSSWQRVPVNDALHAQGHIVLSRRTELVVATVWFTTSEPLAEDATTMRLAWLEDARDATDDARPKRVRTPLDGRHRSRSECRVGWRWRAAYGQSDWLMGPYHATESRGQWLIGLLGRAHVVPYRPMWPGLLGNAILYGALVLAVRVVRRAMVPSKRAREMMVGTDQSQPA